MSLPAHHPFSLEYTADPRPTFAEAHKGNRLIEINDIREAQRSYEANLNVIRSSRSMLQKTIDILR